MRHKIYFGVYIALTMLYAGLSTGLPTDPKVLQRYNITQSHVHLIGLAIALPLIVVWAAALYGFIRFKVYALAIDESREGKSFNYLATGLMIMAFSLPVLGCVSSLFNYLGFRRPDLLPSLTILKNYLNLLFPFLAFWQIAKGAKNLNKSLARRTIVPANSWSLLGIIVITSLYIWLITTRTYGPSGDVAYFLPNWLVISTLAIPYVFIWCKGITAAFYLYTYQKKIRGKIYKRSLQYLAQGIVTIIILSIFIQLITTLSVRLTRLKLTPLLGVVYLLVALYAVGYGLVARGAKKLKQIEEV